jgi:hypothetical protein
MTGRDAAQPIGQRAQGAVRRQEQNMNDDEHDYRNPDHLRFVDDMGDAGLDVRRYRGRFHWAGPAVVVDDLQDALSATKVRCQWDQMGLGWVVYPRAYDHDFGAEEESL